MHENEIVLRHFRTGVVMSSNGITKSGKNNILVYGDDFRNEFSVWKIIKVYAD